MTVAPTTDPSGRKCWSMPALRPRMSGRARSGAAFPSPFAVVPASARAVSSAAISAAASAFASSTFSFSAMSFVPQRALELDLDVDASRQVQPHEGVDRLLRGIVDVDEPLVRADLELLAGVLVDERALDDRELLDARGQRHRTRDRRPGALRGLDDLRRGLVDELVVVRLEP